MLDAQCVPGKEILEAGDKIEEMGLLARLSVGPRQSHPDKPAGVPTHIASDGDNNSKELLV